MTFLDLLLPTLDVYSDVSLIVSWYYQGYYSYTLGYYNKYQDSPNNAYRSFILYAFMMTIPLMLNYLFMSYKWWTMENASDKKWSWILVLLQLWQQWNALKIIYKIFKKDVRAREEKKRMLKELSSIEPFFESVPSTLIMTCIWLYAKSDNSYWRALMGHYECIYCESANLYFMTLTLDMNCSYVTNAIRTGNYISWSGQDNFCAVLGGFGGPSWFYITYGVSIFSGSLGICRFLQYGPVAVLPSNLMSWRFMIAFFAVLLSMVAKGIFLIIIIDMSMKSDPPAIWIVPLMFLLINILPNIVLAAVGLASSTGFNKALTSKIMEYPAFLVLPVFTFFAVGPGCFYQRYLPKCCRDSQDNPPELQLVVSGSLTARATR